MIKIANLGFSPGRRAIFFRSPTTFFLPKLSSSMSSPCRELLRGRRGVGGLMSQSLSSSSSQSISSLSTSFSSQPGSELPQVQLPSPKPKSPLPQFPWLIVGLGNPGKKYQGTRHNVGFLKLEDGLNHRRRCLSGGVRCSGVGINMIENATS